MKKNTLQQLSEHWNRATERAAVETAREQELAQNEMEVAAGIVIRSTVRAGLFGNGGNGGTGGAGWFTFVSFCGMVC